MRPLLSLLCTIAFVLAQALPTPLASSLLPAAITPCRCCDCQQTGCCVSEDAPDRPGGPAVPAPGLRHADFQAVPLEIPRFLLSLLPAPTPAPFAAADAPAVAAVPLFARDCARLL